MLKTAPLMAFVATSNAARARAFYEGILGLTLLSDETFALVFDANGTMLRIQKVESLTPQPFTALGWIVADIQASVEQLLARGVSFERFEGFTQDAHAIYSFPDGTRLAWFKDPDHNLLSLTQFASAR